MLGGMGAKKRVGDAAVKNLEGLEGFGIAVFVGKKRADAGGVWLREKDWGWRGIGLFA